MIQVVDKLIKQHLTNIVFDRAIENSDEFTSILTEFNIENNVLYDCLDESTQHLLQQYLNDIDEDKRLMKYLDSLVSTIDTSNINFEMIDYIVIKFCNFQYVLHNFIDEIVKNRLYAKLIKKIISNPEITFLHANVKRQLEDVAKSRTDKGNKLHNALYDLDEVKDEHFIDMEGREIMSNLMYYEDLINRTVDGVNFDVLDIDQINHFSENGSIKTYIDNLIYQIMLAVK